MKNVAVFVDSGNLFVHLGRVYPGRKLNYQAYLDHARDKDQILSATVYGSQLANEAVKFITCIRHMGFNTKYKRARKGYHASSNVDIAVDVMKIIDRVDIIVLGTADNDLIPLVDYIKSRGVQCVIMASGIGNMMKEACDQWIEIGPDLLEEQKVVQEVVNTIIGEIFKEEECTTSST